MDSVYGKYCPPNLSWEETNKQQGPKDEKRREMRRQKIINLQSVFEDHRPFIWLLGPPGTGKRTQGTAISRYFGYYHISVPVLVIKESRVNSMRGEKVSMLLEAKTKFPEDIALTLFKEYLTQLSQRKRKPGAWLVSGYPRLLREAYRFEREIGRCGLILYMWADSSILAERIFRRNALSNASTPPNLIHYIDKYHERIMPLLQTYSNRLEFIDASKAPENVFLAIKSKLKLFQNNPPKHNCRTYESLWLNFKERAMLDDHFRRNVPYFMPTPISTTRTEKDIPNWWKVENSSSQLYIESNNSLYKRVYREYPPNDIVTPVTSDKNVTKYGHSISSHSTSTPTISQHARKQKCKNISRTASRPYTAQPKANLSNVNVGKKSEKSNTSVKSYTPMKSYTSIKSLEQQRANQFIKPQNLRKCYSAIPIRQIHSQFGLPNSNMRSLSAYSNRKSSMSMLAKVANMKCLDRSNVIQWNDDDIPELLSVVIHPRKQPTTKTYEPIAPEVSKMCMSSAEASRIKLSPKEVQHKENKQNSRNSSSKNKRYTKRKQSQEIKTCSKSQQSTPNDPTVANIPKQLKKPMNQDKYSKFSTSLPNSSKGNRKPDNSTGHVIEPENKSLTVGPNIESKNKKLTPKCKICVEITQEKGDVGNKATFTSHISPQQNLSSPSSKSSAKKEATTSIKQKDDKVNPNVQTDKRKQIQKNTEKPNKSEQFSKVIPPSHGIFNVDVEGKRQGEVTAEDKNSLKTQTSNDISPAEKCLLNGRTGSCSSKALPIKHVNTAKNVPTSPKNNVSTSNSTQSSKMEHTRKHCQPTIAEASCKSIVKLPCKDKFYFEIDPQSTQKPLGTTWSKKSETTKQQMTINTELTARLSRTNTQQAAKLDNSSKVGKCSSANVKNNVTTNSKAEFINKENQDVQIILKSEILPSFHCDRNKLSSAKPVTTEQQTLESTETMSGASQTHAQQTGKLEHFSKLRDSSSVRVTNKVKTNSKMEYSNKEQQDVKTQLGTLTPHATANASSSAKQDTIERNTFKKTKKENGTSNTSTPHTGISKQSAKLEHSSKVKESSNANIIDEMKTNPKMVFSETKQECIKIGHDSTILPHFHTGVNGSSASKPITMKQKTFKTTELTNGTSETTTRQSGKLDCPSKEDKSDSGTITKKEKTNLNTEFSSKKQHSLKTQLESKILPISHTNTNILPSSKNDFSSQQIIPVQRLSRLEMKTAVSANKTCTAEPILHSKSSPNSGVDGQFKSQEILKGRSKSETVQGGETKQHSVSSKRISSPQNKSPKQMSRNSNVKTTKRMRSLPGLPSKVVPIDNKENIQNSNVTASKGPCTIMIPSSEKGKSPNTVVPAMQENGSDTLKSPDTSVLPSKKNEVSSQQVSPIQRLSKPKTQTPVSANKTCTVEPLSHSKPSSNSGIDGQSQEILKGKSKSEIVEGKETKQHSISSKRISSPLNKSPKQIFGNSKVKSTNCMQSLPRLPSKVVPIKNEKNVQNSNVTPSKEVRTIMAPSSKKEKSSNTIPSTIQVSGSDTSVKGNDKSMSTGSKSLSNNSSKTNRSLKIKSHYNGPTNVSSNTQITSKKIVKFKTSERNMRNSADHVNNMEGTGEMESLKSIISANPSKLLSDRNINIKSSANKEMLTKTEKPDDNSSYGGCNMCIKSTMAKNIKSYTVLKVKLQNTNSAEIKLPTTVEKSSSAGSTLVAPSVPVRSSVKCDENSKNISMTGLPSDVKDHQSSKLMIDKTEPGKQTNSRGKVKSSTKVNSATVVESTDSLRSSDKSVPSVSDKPSLKNGADIRSNNCLSIKSNNVNDKVLSHLTPQPISNHSALTKSTYDKQYSSLDQGNRKSTSAAKEDQGTNRQYYRIYRGSRNKAEWITVEVAEKDLGMKNEPDEHFESSKPFISSSSEKSTAPNVSKFNLKAAHQKENLNKGNNGSCKGIKRSDMIIKSGIRSLALNSQCSTAGESAENKLPSSNPQSTTLPSSGSPKIYVLSNGSQNDSLFCGSSILSRYSKHEHFSDDSNQSSPRSICRQSPKYLHRESWSPFSSVTSLDIFVTPVQESNLSMSDVVLVRHRSSLTTSYLV